MSYGKLEQNALFQIPTIKTTILGLMFVRVVGRLFTSLMINLIPELDGPPLIVVSMPISNMM